MKEAAEGVIRIIGSLSPGGVIIVSVVVALALAVVLIAHFSGLYQDRRRGGQEIVFVDRLVADVDKLLVREAALRADLERQEQESDGNRLRAAVLQADVELMRMQLRRAIETLRAVRDGRLHPSAITDADLAEAVR